MPKQDSFPIQDQKATNEQYEWKKTSGAHIKIIFYDEQEEEQAYKIRNTYCSFVRKTLSQ